MLHRYNGKHTVARAISALSVRVRIGIIVAILGGLSVAGLTLAGSASAVTGYHVVVGSAGLNARSGPGTGFPVVGTTIANGQPIDISCQTKGTLVGVGLPGTPTDVWDKLADGRYITDYYTSTPGVGGSYTPGIPQCGNQPVPPPPPAPKTIYNRQQAASWALSNVNNPNGSPFFSKSKNSDGIDCTFFVSSALWAGGLPKSADWTNWSLDWNKLASHKKWIPGATKDAANADYFKNYVVNNHIATIKEVSWSDNTAGGAQLGDVIGYDWWNSKTNSNGPDGILDHLAIVTSVRQNGPWVTQHSPSDTRYWSWDPAGNWIRVTHPGSRVYLIHIIM